MKVEQTLRDVQASRSRLRFILLWLEQMAGVVTDSDGGAGGGGGESDPPHPPCLTLANSILTILREPLPTDGPPSGGAAAVAGASSARSKVRCQSLFLFKLSFYSVKWSSPPGWALNGTINNFFRVFFFLNGNARRVWRSKETVSSWRSLCSPTIWTPHTICCPTGAACGEKHTLKCFWFSSGGGATVDGRIAQRNYSRGCRRLQGEVGLRR